MPNEVTPPITAPLRAASAEMVAESMVVYCWIARWQRSARAPNAISNVQNRTVGLRSTRFVKSSSKRYPDLCARFLARVDPGFRHHGGRNRERDYRANEGAEHDKPEICLLHVSYLKHSKTDISENVRSLPRATEFSLVGGDFSPVRSATGRTRLATASLSIGQRGELGLHVV